jgi:hypothetical protein
MSLPSVTENENKMAGIIENCYGQDAFLPLPVMSLS